VYQRFGTSAVVVSLLGVVGRIRHRLGEGAFTGLEKLDRAELDETDEAA